MGQLRDSVMKKLYGHDIWAGYEPKYVEDKVQGWHGTHPSLSRLTSTPGPKIVIDIGVWKGESTISMAQAMKSGGIDGAVIAIDTFLGSREHWFQFKHLYERENGQPSLYWTFLSNVVRAGLTDYVIPMPQTSTTAAIILKEIDVKASIVHVDAAHEYREVLRDSEDYWDLLEDGGYLIGDDYSENWPGVIRAAGEFSARLCLPLTIQKPKWIMQKPLASVKRSSAT
jgi:hypothetical protein